MRKEILRYVKLPNDAEALDIANDAINGAIRVLNRHVWSWTLVSTDITLVADQRDYTVPSNVKAPRRLFRVNSSSEEDGWLDYKDPQSFMIEHPRVTASRASRVYTLENVHEYGQLTLEYPASSTFISNYPTLRFWYYRRVPLISESAGAATLDAPNEVDEFVRWYARYEVATLYSPDKVREARGMWRDALKQLKVDDKRKHDWAMEPQTQWLTA
jgi:hypothetical protein